MVTAFLAMPLRTHDECRTMKKVSPNNSRSGVSKKSRERPTERERGFKRGPGYIDALVRFKRLLEFESQAIAEAESWRAKSSKARRRKLGSEGMEREQAQDSRRGRDAENTSNIGGAAKNGDKK